MKVGGASKAKETEDAEAADACADERTCGARRGVRDSSMAKVGEEGRETADTKLIADPVVDDAADAAAADEDDKDDDAGDIADAADADAADKIAGARHGIML